MTVCPPGDGKVAPDVYCRGCYCYGLYEAAGAGTQGSPYLPVEGRNTVSRPVARAGKISPYVEHTLLIESDGAHLVISARYAGTGVGKG